jgi:hypothetical protein
MLSSDPQTRSSTMPYRAAICLILVTLLLYNPFLTFLGSSANIIVHHPLSYRSTVAGSELQRCTCECPASQVAALAVLESSAAMPDAAVKTGSLAVVESFARPSLTLGGSIWFRPPPNL